MSEESADAGLPDEILEESPDENYPVEDYEEQENE